MYVTNDFRQNFLFFTDFICVMSFSDKHLGISPPYPTKRLEVIRYKIPIKDQRLVITRIKDFCICKIISVNIESVGSGCFDPFGSYRDVFENKSFDTTRY